jgi:hypothetical protein
MCSVCRLYHVRGPGDSKQCINDKSITSIVRSKLFHTRLVPTRREALPIVRADHREHEDGHNTAEGRLAETYYIVNLRVKHAAVSGKNCPTCAAFEPVKKKPVDPILTTRRGQLVMFDLTKFYVPVICVNTHATSSFAQRVICQNVVTTHPQSSNIVYIVLCKHTQQFPRSHSV